MGIILKTNELGYLPFLNTDVTSIIVGLKGFCVNQKYSVSLKDLKDVIYSVKTHNKRFYLSVNLFAKEKELEKFKRIFNQLITYEIDCFIVSDLGILNLFIEKNLQSKVILDLNTYVTNKYSAKALMDLGLKRVCLAKEITLKDIQEISLYNDGKIEVLAQGYTPIAYSQRPILDLYYKKYKIKKNSTLHYLKEETRDSYYLLNQNNNNLTVYYDKQYSLFSNLKELVNSDVRHYRIDADFMDETTIKSYIHYYKKGTDLAVLKKEKELDLLIKEFTQNYTFDSPFLFNKSILLKGGSKDE